MTNLTNVSLQIENLSDICFQKEVVNIVRLEHYFYKVDLKKKKNILNGLIYTLRK